MLLWINDDLMIKLVTIKEVLLNLKGTVHSASVRHSSSDVLRQLINSF